MYLFICLFLFLSGFLLFFSGFSKLWQWPKQYVYVYQIDLGVDFFDLGQYVTNQNTLEPYTSSLAATQNLIATC